MPDGQLFHPPTAGPDGKEDGISDQWCARVTVGKTAAKELEIAEDIADPHWTMFAKLRMHSYSRLRKATSLAVAVSMAPPLHATHAWEQEIGPDLNPVRAGC